MTYLLVRHRVSNYSEWYRRFATELSTRQADGELTERIFRNALDPREVLVLYEWDDLDRARIFSLSDDFHDTIPYADLQDQPNLWFLEEPGQSFPRVNAIPTVPPKEE